MPKIKVDKDLYQKLKDYSEKAGYSSVDEFIIHCLQNEIDDAGGDSEQNEVKDRLQGLGYI